MKFHELLKIMPVEQSIIVHYPSGYVSKDTVSDYKNRYDTHYLADSFYNYDVFHIFTKGKSIVINLTNPISTERSL